jgi:ribose transport system permease protein/L-arabinose transport system permease protein
MTQTTTTPPKSGFRMGADTSPNILEWLRRHVGIQNLGLLITLAILVIFIGSQQGDKFFRPVNILNIGLSVSLLGLVAIAQTFVMLSGGLDISLGSAVGLGSVAAAYGIMATGSPWGGIVGAILVCSLCGLLNGVIITYGRLNPVITTLGTLYVFRGIAYIITDAKPIGVQNAHFNAIGSGRLLDIPIPLLVLAVVSVIFMIFLRYTDVGRNIYAMGGNPVAARLSGINLNRYRLGIYVLSGVIAGIAAIILTARTNSGQPASGSIGLEFQAITAAVLGGTALSGGKGTIMGTLLGVIVIGTLNNGMILMGIETFYQELARGVLLIVATLIQVWQTRETRG